MKIRYPLLLGALFIIIQGCKKNNDGDMNTGKIKSEAVVNTTNAGNSFTDSIQYRYDAEGRLTNIQHTAGNNVQFTYSGNTLTQIQQAGNGTTFAPWIYQLNQQGMAVSDNQGYQYTYNNAGQLLTKIINGTGFTDTTLNTYTSGNLTLAIDVFLQTNSVQPNEGHYTYTYLLDKIDNRNNIASFLGKGSTNLLAYETLPGNTETIYFAYTYDSKGRVATESQTTTTSGVNSVSFVSKVTGYTYY